MRRVDLVLRAGTSCEKGTRLAKQGGDFSCWDPFQTTLGPTKLDRPLMQMRCTSSWRRSSLLFHRINMTFSHNYFNFLK